MDALTIIFLVLVGFLQAVMGSTVTGGGIIAVPALMAAGVPPHVALGTVRPAYLTGTVVGMWRFKIKGYLRLKEGLPLIVPAFLGAFIGASWILQVSETMTKYIIAAVVMVSVALLLVKKDLGVSKIKKKHAMFNLMLIGLGVGVVSGAVGVFGGTMAMMALVIFEGYTLKEAVAMNTIRALGNQTAGLLVFALASAIWWDYALAAMTGSILGTLVGVEITHRIPLNVLKTVFIAISLLFVANFLFF